MELFSSAGIDLPTSGGGGGRRQRALVRSLHVPLFNYKAVSNARNVALFEPSAAQVHAASDYARKIKDPKFLKQKETAVRGLLIQDLLQTVLGYQGFDPGKPFTLAIERPIRSGAVDVALGNFNTVDAVDEIVAPFELKGPGTADLDRVMPGRGRSAVQQAWDYAIDAPGSRWVLVSNCLEIRLYGFGRGREAYERFDLTRLDEPDEHARLWLILSASRFLGGQTDQLLRDSDSAYRDITNDLYTQYKDLRERLIGFLTSNAEGARLGVLPAIEVAQKLLDRVLFIAFAQRTDLMPDRLLERASKEINTFDPRPLWRNFQGLFQFVDVGSDRHGIPAYNGGLFAPDPVADAVILPDPLAEEVAALGQWDYRREIPVTVLGHLFEQSITDIEAMKALTRGEAPPSVSKRKREGVVYTPDLITRFLVEQTIGKTLNERRAALWSLHGLAKAGKDGAGPDIEIAFWRAYLDTLRDFTIVDPACGSGAFLVAAFDEMARRYREAASALESLEADIDFDIFDEIVTRNLHGVDLNPESVEITRLSLWLKTARRNHRLQNLEATIKDGNSLIDDPAYTDRPFDWQKRFPDVFARGGFDVVIGNPPYVRMEYLKPVKPYLQAHYEVAADRADLYAYFFEQGVRLLKPGGRLGYISSSTFFRTGSGENLRSYLADKAAVESVIDFGDIQLFEGVTTYPAIIAVQKVRSEPNSPLSYLTLKDSVPDDLGRAFLKSGKTMPRSRLGAGSWQFEEDALAALRHKISAGRKTLGEVYGAPLYGIKTGLNEAFVIDRATRDRLVAADPRSAELLKPFLRGEDVRRWRVESNDLFLINTPRGSVDIEAYPAIQDWLASFKPALERRATKQNWWELQQGQLAYQPKLDSSKIVWPHFQNDRSFTLDKTGSYLNNKCFFIPNSDPVTLAILNSKCLWFQLFNLARVKRGGYIEAEAQYVEQLSLPTVPCTEADQLTAATVLCTLAAKRRLEIQTSVRYRILDLAPPERRKLNNKLMEWHELDFAGFRAEIKKAFGVEIPVKQRAEWEGYIAGQSAEVKDLSARIADAENQIDKIVYALFGLTPEEIALLEAS